MTEEELQAKWRRALGSTTLNRKTKTADTPKTPEERAGEILGELGLNASMIAPEERRSVADAIRQAENDAYERAAKECDDWFERWEDGSEAAVRDRHPQAGVEYGWKAAAALRLAKKVRGLKHKGKS